MTVSDFISGNPNTHTLLYRLFASEVGLLSVAHPTAQFDALVHAYAPLKQAALAGVGETTAVSLVMADYSTRDISISGRDEAHLFIELYKGLELFTGGTAFADEYSQTVTLSQLVYPMAAKTIEALPEFADAVAQQLQEHMAQYGAAVRTRVLRDLSQKFRFSPEFLARFESGKPTTSTDEVSS